MSGGSLPDERPPSRLEILLEELCQDSLEVPLSHVDDPTCTGDITDRYREARELVRGAEATIERQRPVIEAAEGVANQNSETASTGLQLALSKLDFALDRLAALSEGEVS